MESTIQLQKHANLLTVPEAAAELRISKWKMYQLIRANELKTLTIGSRRFVASDDLVGYVDMRRDAENET